MTRESAELPQVRVNPRILMLASNTPQRIGTGSSMRTYHFARALSRFGDLTIGLFSPENEYRQSSVDFPALVVRPPSGRLTRKTRRAAGWVDAISVALMPWRDKWSGLLRYIVAMSSEPPRVTRPGRKALSSVFRAEFAIASRYFNPMPLMTFWQRRDFAAIRKPLELEIRQSGFDIVWFEHGFNLPLVEELLASTRLRSVIVCNTHNMEFHLAEQFASKANAETGLSDWQRQPALLQRVESRAFEKSDLVIVCSDGDNAIALRQVPSATVLTAENGVDTDYFRPSGSITRDAVPTVLFTGLFTYPPNLDAAKYFLSEILPLIQQRVPECRIVFAGRHASSALESHVAGLRNVECVSDPIDMRPEFERAWVFAAPLRMGGGTRLKILEAMAMECPVVSTSIGAEGMPYVPGKHLLIADDAQGFATEIVRLISDTELRAVISTEAAKLVRGEYDWSKVTEKAIRRLGNLLDVKRRG
jgi:glycosyltransferase involved in cell wall biosynthesis